MRYDSLERVDAYAPIQTAILDYIIRNYPKFLKEAEIPVANPSLFQNPLEIERLFKTITPSDTCLNFLKFLYFQNKAISNVKHASSSCSIDEVEIVNLVSEIRKFNSLYSEKGGKNRLTPYIYKGNIIFSSIQNPMSYDSKWDNETLNYINGYSNKADKFFEDENSSNLLERVLKEAVEKTYFSGSLHNDSRMDDLHEWKKGILGRMPKGTSDYHFFDSIIELTMCFYYMMRSFPVSTISRDINQALSRAKTRLNGRRQRLILVFGNMLKYEYFQINKIHMNKISDVDEGLDLESRLQDAVWTEQYHELDYLTFLLYRSLGKNSLREEDRDESLKFTHRSRVISTYLDLDWLGSLTFETEACIACRLGGSSMGFGLIDQAKTLYARGEKKYKLLEELINITENEIRYKHGTIDQQTLGFNILTDLQIKVGAYFSRRIDRILQAA